MILAVHASTGEVLYVNPAIERLLSYAPETVIGRSFPDICAPEAVLRSAELIADAWEKGGAVSTELVLKSATGEKVPVEVSTRVTEVAKKPAIILYVRDIRERLRLQRIIEEKNKQLVESIEYARRLQLGALPTREELQNLFPASFWLYLPRDIVSGDFYWVGQREGTRYLAIGDCTGHGVPGAMMVMLSLAFLNQALNFYTTPAEILTFMHRNFCAVFDVEKVRDGAELILLAFPPQGPLMWASANRPLWYVEQGQFYEKKGERAPLGGSTDIGYTWQNQTLSLSAPARLFLSTDGYADQFGGPKSKKLTTREFKRILEESAALPLDQQEDFLRRFFSSWRGELEQVDDVLVVGVEVR